MMTADMMNVVQVHEPGGPEVLRYEQAPVPDLKDGEVLIRVRAVGVNPPDWYLREGMTVLPPELRPTISYPFILGTDVSGTVEAVAANAGSFSPGDEVFGLIRFPDAEARAYAEYVAVPASDLALKPGGIDHIHAAAAPMAGLTAWQFLIDLGHQTPSPFQAALHRPVPLEAGTRVLVNGAAGGVGHMAVQLAKWKGAHVTAVASGVHEPFLSKLGVDEFIDYTTDRAEEVAHDLDLVLDTVGGPESGRFLRAIKRGGALFPVFMALIDPQEAAKQGVSVSSTQVRASGRQLAELGRLLDSGTVQVAIDSTFPLAEASRAHERAARGHIEGKIVLTVA
jgi:NADPH:quinone reductase-like Zn-dependent oxidoreductase